jgi:site-specific DNA-methyltransferase (cytosine-N4-specific)
MSDLPAGRIITGDCVKTMQRLPAGSIDQLLTSPPYPRIKREYGSWTERTWLTWMRGVVIAASRTLKPSGSMVFVIGPNAHRVGEMAMWPYRFVLDVVDAGLNVVQDAYWIKPNRIPLAACAHGLFRDAVEWCVWIGPRDCYRDQKAILWEYSDTMKRLVDLGRRSRLPSNRTYTPSGNSTNRSAMAVDRGGATPMNIIVSGVAGKEADGHPAAFPEPLAAFWIKYLCPPGGVVLDPFAGSGTTCATAKRLGRAFVGIERCAAYARKARSRIRRTRSGVGE